MANSDKVAGAEAGLNVCSTCRYCLLLRYVTWAGGLPPPTYTPDLIMLARVVNERQSDQ